MSKKLVIFLFSPSRHGIPQGLGNRAVVEVIKISIRVNCEATSPLFHS